ncbi:MAG: division plane positioning ATPase MipZ [Sphingomonadaceae bacterium]|uniref:division plane positioning ATPase MipZ n=1 Tax=Thermaurantiacus sp. TaxID=2820283 RepID=UPI00298ED694|nr:division plane positioning ATPase MipZ [Thermaurantiacus sp.]MCS6986000.1 division plane positioning ATPase MipZ [Sphingomonadaceae bacterium]MDW8414784.1 division plane positioning ATPase MipZ [Thermaurantiacus sp.]
MSTTCHRLVLANEKGGTGKSTLAVHLAVWLVGSGHPAHLIDLDRRQRTSFRYLENRRRHAAARGRELPMPEASVPADDALETAVEAAAKAGARVVVIDTPGRDSPEGRAALAMADTLVTPINDSFVDLDLLGEVDDETFAIRRPSFYAETVWRAKAARARRDGATLDWVLLRNRLSPLEARNRRRVGAALAELSRRVGFRIAPGLAERVIYRELFPSGLTVLDVDGELTLSHVAARAELRELAASLGLDRLGRRDGPADVSRRSSDRHGPDMMGHA